MNAEKFKSHIEEEDHKKAEKEQQSSEEMLEKARLFSEILIDGCGMTGGRSESISDELMSSGFFRTYSGSSEQNFGFNQTSSVSSVNNNCFQSRLKTSSENMEEVDMKLEEGEIEEIPKTTSDGTLDLVPRKMLRDSGNGPLESIFENGQMFNNPQITKEIFQHMLQIHQMLKFKNTITDQPLKLTRRLVLDGRRNRRSYNKPRKWPNIKPTKRLYDQQTEGPSKRLRRRFRKKTRDTRVNLNV